MKVKFKKLHADAIIPKKAHDIDAAFDLVAVSAKQSALDIMEYGTGLAIEIPPGYVGLVFQRSSVCKKSLSLTNAVGVIDPGYTGEIIFKFRMLSRNQAEELLYHKGDRIGQIMLVKTEEVVFEETTELTPSERGSSGYGGSGN